MKKRANHYRLRLEQISLAKEDMEHADGLVLEFENHDEIFEVITRIRERNFFDDDEQSIAFALGLKLFSDVMVRHREHPLFEELLPAFQIFMRRLKSWEAGEELRNM